jgi:arylsulfatase A-like enzyme
MSKPSSQPPNVLVIITDQQRADHVGFMGNQTLSTPNLDGLASQSVVFQNAWVSNPVCMPNRCSILTGRMPTAHGVIFNDRSLEWNANTFVRQFKEANYSTTLIGKSHLQHGMSRNSMVPFRGKGAFQDLFPKGWDEIENYENYLESDTLKTKDFYGFSEIELAIDHGARISGHHLLWALEKGANKDELLVEYDASAPGTKRSHHWWQIYQPPYADEYHSTSFVAERTIDHIRSKSNEGNPWLIWSSFPDPHHPMTPPGKWFDRHKPQDMTLPKSRSDKLSDAPEHLRFFQGIHPKEQREWVAPCGYGSDDLLREAIAATYGMIEMVDDGIGKIIKCLKETGELENTIIVFTSDHGDMMGDHGLFLKGFMHYKGTLQVPLMINAPGVAPEVNQALASSIDICPTLLELAGIPFYEGIQGKSLHSILAGKQKTVRDCILVEDDIATITAKLTPIPSKTRTIITTNHRYSRNSKAEEQLFNLIDDPEEMTDLKSKKPETKSLMVEQMMDMLIDADDAARGAPTTSTRTA